MNRSFRNRAFFISLCLPILITFLGCGQKKTAEMPQAIAWMTDLNQGIEMARAKKKPLMIDFMAEWCPTCQKMEATTFKDPEVIKRSAGFIPVQIDVDQQGELADSLNCNAGKYGGIGIPNILFLTAEGNELRHPIGFRSAETFLAEMDSVLMMIKN
jgi:thiol:disulfide interchange protein DsbD